MLANAVLVIHFNLVLFITNRDDARFDALIAEYRLQRAIGML